MFDFEAAFEKVQKRRDEETAEIKARVKRREDRLTELIEPLQSFIKGRGLDFIVGRKPGKITISNVSAGTMEVEVNDNGTFNLMSRGSEYSAQQEVEGVELADEQTAAVLANWLTAPFH